MAENDRPARGVWALRNWALRNSSDMPQYGCCVRSIGNLGGHLADAFTPSEYPVAIEGLYDIRFFRSPVSREELCAWVILSGDYEIEDGAMDGDGGIDAALKEAEDATCPVLLDGKTMSLSDALCVLYENPPEGKHATIGFAQCD